MSDKLKDKRDIINKKMHEPVFFDDNEIKIGVYAKPKENIEDTINWLVGITELFIIYFTNYTHYYDDQNMWRYNKKGIL